MLANKYEILSLFFDFFIILWKLLQQKSQLQRDLQEANELNTKAMVENKELISELENKKWVYSFFS